MVTRDLQNRSYIAAWLKSQALCLYLYTQVLDLTAMHTWVDGQHHVAAAAVLKARQAAHVAAQLPREQFVDAVHHL